MPENNKVDSRKYYRPNIDRYTIGKGKGGTEIGWRPDYSPQVGNLESVVTTASESGSKNPSVLVLREYQPKFTIDYLDLFNAAVEGVGKIQAAGASASSTDPTDTNPNADTKGLKGKAGVAGEVAADLASRSASKVIANLIVQGASETKEDSDKAILQQPVDFIKGMMAYTTENFLTEYECPAFNLSKYINLNTSQGGWGANEGEGLKTDNTTVSGYAAGMIKTLAKGANLKFPTLPKWEPNTSTPPPLTHEFNLYNYDVKALANNYMYINSLNAACQWVQIGAIQLHSNLFEVHLPGRFNWLMCAVDIEIEYVGMAKSLGVAKEEFAAIVNGKADSAGDAGFDWDSGTSTGGLESLIVGNNVLSGKFPESYNIRLTIRSLMPHNLNMYLDYIRKDDINYDRSTDNADTLAAAGVGVISAAATNFGDAVSAGTTDVSDAASSALNALTNTPNNGFGSLTAGR